MNRKKKLPAFQKGHSCQERLSIYTEINGPLKEVFLVPPWSHLFYTQF